MPNILFLMTDQQRFDTIAALGNSIIDTPNLDRLVRRGLSLNGYSTCPVCVPARYTIRTGCEPSRTGVYQNQGGATLNDDVRGACGAYLAEVLAAQGYRTFGIGKFHTSPWDAPLGFEVHLHTEELYAPGQRQRDSYASFIATEHPEYDWVEGLMGERTDMYYIPQMSPLPAHLGVEAWVADRACEQLADPDGRPFFGMVSFIGPHPPFAPPIPYNRYYDPDRMPDPVAGDPAIDHQDEQIPWMNHATFADDIGPGLARSLKARYYGEITYIDGCIGRILDALEARSDADDTLICFYADHGDHLGDHRAWQKESFFEGATRIPMLVSWPSHLPANEVRPDLACLTDLFAIATAASGQLEVRDGHDLLGALEGQTAPRDQVIGLYGPPGTPRFKIMVRTGNWKYIYLANGGFEQLFNVTADPHEIRELHDTEPDVTATLRQAAVAALTDRGVRSALTDDGRSLRPLPFEQRPLRRIYQFDASRGITSFGPGVLNAARAQEQGQST